MFCYQIYLAHSSLFTNVCSRTFTQVSVLLGVLRPTLPSFYFAYQRKGCFHFDGLRAIYIIRWNGNSASSPDSYKNVRIMNNAKLVITNCEKAFKNIKTMNISILPPPEMLI